VNKFSHDAKTQTSKRGRVNEGRPIYRLTPREREVFGEIVHKGATNKEIGQKLGLSPRTVELHRRRILAKYGASSTVRMLVTVLKEARRD
jgi:DNA-binding NarL/FixJ family response regulator